MTGYDPEVADALRRATATIRDLRERLDRWEGPDGSPRPPTAGARPAEPLAVVAMACRLPGGVTSPEELWQLLLHGGQAVDRVEDWRWAGRPPAVGGGEFAGTVRDVSAFDPAFFGIGAAEAAVMDPQQRLLVTLAWEVLERWGRVPETLVDSATGVFVGVGHQDYLMAMLAAGNPVTGHVAPGNARSIVANRVSYLFGLRGPSMVVDTACSSSLVAVHLAAQSLLAGECDAAIAGGVNLILAPESTLVTGRALPLSPDGRTKTFDAGADGMVRGEGAGVVVLRRLSDALADGDHVHAVLRATGTNQDGRTNGLTAPSPAAQELLLRAVLDRSGLRPEEVGYVETHGTGTPLGDPIELDALQRAYGGEPGSASQRCWVGSVKPNLGHLESAAGIASLLKAVLAVERGAIPPQVSFRTLNPEIRLDGSRFAIPTVAVPWEHHPRRAAVSSFGFGGTNAHAVLESGQAATGAGARHVGGQETDTTPLILPLTGHTPTAVHAAVHRYAALPEGLRAADVAGAAARRRTHHAFRRAVVTTPAAWRHDIAEAARDRRVPTRVLPGRTAFVFAGQGTTWDPAVLGDPDVVAEARRWDEECAAAGAGPVSPTLTAVAADPRLLGDTRNSQLAIAVVQTAMVRALAGLGLLPDAVLGHSLGEIVAAMHAQRLTRADAARLIRARSSLQQAHVGHGAMASLEAGPADVAGLLRRHGNGAVGIAVCNGARATVIAGPPDAVRTVMKASPWPAKRLDVGYAFHSPALGVVPADEPELRDPGRPGCAAVELVSTVTGARIDHAPLPPGHWVRNLAGAVRFQAAVNASLTAGVTRFVEISPHPALTTHIAAAADEAGIDVVAVAAGRRDGAWARTLAEAAAKLWEAGAALDWSVPHPTAPFVPELPTSAFEESPHWFSCTDRPLTEHRAADADPSGAQESIDAPAVERLISELVAEVAGFESAAEVDTSLPATELDVDSSEFVEVKNRLEDRLGRAVPITWLLDGASIADLAQRLVRPDSAAVGDILDGRSVDDLSETELDLLLSLHEHQGGHL